MSGASMTETLCIIGAWLVTFGAVGAYAASVILRGRRLSKVVPPEQRRWM
ncbi:unannotated protein [freshwater metagenome]|uniref:Unannotated protein n=1 Tax=freshwater metagenome TaxID=449393 RepID=A0A6J6C4W7_9ZZZZ|nr:hypothetical protein [Actinomycetota bacterium]